MPATDSCTTTIPTRCRPSWPRPRASGASTHLRDSSTTSCVRRTEPMRFGYWLPVFGGWLRNVPDEQMEASWDYVSRLARRSKQLGFDVTLIAELNLNATKGPEPPSLAPCPTTPPLPP